ncbi:MAG: PocR ligand-binding domain-containing protein [Desulfobulbus sp.]
MTDNTVGFTDLVDIIKLQEQCESFTRMTSAVTAILDLEGNVLVATGWQEICTRFHRINPATAARCHESDTILAGRLNEGQPYNVYKCKNGLVDVAVPIIIGGRHMANFFTGQFFFSVPDREYFIHQAEEFGFSREAYLKALDRVPVFSEAQVSNMMVFFSSLTSMIGESGLARQELKSHRDHLEELVSERTAELAMAMERTEAANKAKSEFLANMSHELRTPLNAILGYSQLMQRAPSLEPEHREYLQTINRSGEHLLELINDVLEISKIEAGRITLDPHTFDLHAMLHDLYALFKLRTDEKGLSFDLSDLHDLPRYVVTDENKFRQVLINLLGNAVKFTDRGGIVLRAAVKIASPENSSLVVEVEDTGPGIAQKELHKVFQVFEQTTVGKNSLGGTGLGMAISRDYARIMGGDITVSSREGAGSTFRFEISVEEGKESDLRERVQPQRVIGLAPGQAVPRILVVEDNEVNRTLLVRLLKQVGFDIRKAENGAQAVEIFAQWAPQFIWMDIRMPVMDGLEATRRIKAAPGGATVKIVALTASALLEERGSIQDAGCDDLVFKPYLESDLFEVMAKHLKLVYLYEQGEPQASAAPETALRPQDLASLPADLREKLLQAVLGLDTVGTLVTVAAIGRQNAAIGQVLQRFAENLEYDRLLALLEGDNTTVSEVK